MCVCVWFVGFMIFFFFFFLFLLVLSSCVFAVYALAFLFCFVLFCWFLLVHRRFCLLFYTTTSNETALFFYITNGKRDLRRNKKQNRDNHIRSILWIELRLVGVPFLFSRKITNEIGWIVFLLFEIFNGG